MNNGQQITLEDSLRENFARYAGMTIQQRALVDVRDGLKPSARMAMYAQYLDKITYKNPTKKSAKSIAAGLDHFYVHGDSSLYGLLMRLGKTFTSRYPLEDVQGNVGDLRQSGNEAHYRYTQMRLNKLGTELFEGIDKDTINRWFNNYDDTEQYPAVIPSKGYYNICNGTSGIATALASSIPQFNLREVNEALITLLWNPDATFEELYCPPDFATGATLINEEEVKESLKVGVGKACKLRSTITYDADEHALVVTEIPYGVYTDTITNQIADIINGDISYGIAGCIDLTKGGFYPHIKIRLTKAANPERVAKVLLKETSLQYHYGINMVMLEDGRAPRVFGWKDALAAHLNHEKEVYRRSYEFDLKKLQARLHIVEGVLAALAQIEEVIKTIKTSKSSATAKTNLMNKYNFSEIQAKAILDIKLVRLANLEIDKFEKEKATLLKGIKEIQNILSDKKLLYVEIEKGFRDVSKAYGDNRRTKLTNLVFDEDGNEPLEEKSLLISLTNHGNIYTKETSTLITQRRGGVGKKIRMEKGEYVIDTISDTNSGVAVFFSNKGRYFSYRLAELQVDEKINTHAFLELENTEEIFNITTLNSRTDFKYIVFVTKKGMIKKSNFSEYNTKRVFGVQALTLQEGDELCQVLFMNEEQISVLSSSGRCARFETKDIRPIKRIGRGVQSLKLENGEKIVSACAVSEDIKEFISIATDGLIKRTNIEEIPVKGRRVKGVVLQKISAEGDSIVDFIPVTDEKELIVITSSVSIKILIKDIPLTARNAQGAQAVKMKSNDKAIAIVKNI